MVHKSFNSLSWTALTVAVAWNGAMLQFPSPSNAATPTGPRLCQALSVAVLPQSQSGLPDPDWTIDGQVKQWWQQSSVSSANGTQVTEHWVTSVAFSPDGRTLVSSSRYKEAASEKERAVVGVPVGTQGLNGRVDIWQNLNKPESEWRQTALYTSKREINTVAFNPVGTPLLAAGGNDKGFVGLWGQRQWNTARAQPQDQTNSQYQVNAVAFSPDGRLLASGGIRGRSGKGYAIQRWDVRQGKLSPIKNPLQLVGSTQSPNLIEDQEVYAIAFSPDSKILAAGGYSTFFERQGTVYKRLNAASFLHFWEAQSGKYLCTISNPSSLAVSAIAFSPDGTLLAIGDSNGSIQIWSLTTKELLTTFRHKGRVMAISFSPSGKILLSGSTDRTAKLWKIPSGELIRTFDHTAEVTSVAFSPDGQAFAIGDRDSKIRLISAAQ